MPTVAQLREVEPLALAPAAAARTIAISKRSLSRLIADGKIIARKDGTRTLVDFESLKAYYRNLPFKAESEPLACSGAAAPPSRGRARGLGQRVAP